MQTSALQGDTYADDAPLTPQFDSDISQGELVNMAEDYQDSMSKKQTPQETNERRRPTNIGYWGTWSRFVASTTLAFRSLW